ncbi:phytanoyl-CoA dioxygenase family protein [Lineolata rhizophorae]|uniref:Phytanoyl-CoA dioxygenase family protein n=1 Tax=Lineolata rhizophorae TaxID=578093 RepID=A0A6A6NYH6_9PEZI|nr:phytanoyl-CoA dioxygenase family protein [Lineolata rhizophorae]
MAPSAITPPAAEKLTDKAKFTVDSFDGATAQADDLVASIIRNGGVIIRNMLTAAELAQLEEDVRPHLEADVAWDGDFFPKETRRVCGLVGKSRAFTERVCLHELYKGICDALLSSRFEYWVGQEKHVSVSKPQINSTTVLSIRPGARAQELHRDDMIHHNRFDEITADEYKPGRDTAIGIFVAGKKTTKANGATRFVPGSHLQKQDAPPVEEDAVHAELDPGDGLIMLASCYHGGSANTTEDEERLVYGAFVTKGVLRQEENQYLAVPLETIKSYPTETQEFLGYGVSAPFLGWLELQSPLSVLFGKKIMNDLY